MHRVLIIGCGNIAGGFDSDRPATVAPLTHAGAYLRHGGFELAACVDPDDRRRAEFQARWSVAEAGESLAALGAEPGAFDLVSICSPTAFHHDHMEAALALRPRLIFCEKPVTPAADMTAGWIEQCDAAGVKLAVNYTRRWDPRVADLARDLRAGIWGEVRSAVGVYTKGVVHNGAHMVDLLHMLLGPIRLIAAGRPVWDFWDDDPSVPALLQSDNGVPIHLAVGHSSDYALFELMLITERGEITMCGGGQTWTVRTPRDSAVFAGYRTLGDQETSEGGYDHAMLKAVANIADALVSDAKLASTGGNALAAQHMCESIRSAALPAKSSTP
jgi:predicted dehydrogenase